MSKRELSPDVEVVSEPKEPEYVTALRAAKARINTPDKWCQDVYHLGGASCMLGALGWGKCAWVAADAANDASRLLQRVVGVNSVPLFNDDPSTTHADVMAAFDLAIEQATKEWLKQR